MAAVPETWDQADELLAQMRELLGQALALIEEHGRAAVELDRRYLSPARVLTEDAERRADQVRAFVAAHAAELGGRGRSRRLVHGVVGLRRMPPRVDYAVSESDTIQRLKARGHTECFRLVEQLDRRALARLSRAEAQHCGLVLERRADQPYIELTGRPR